LAFVACSDSDKDKDSGPTDGFNSDTAGDSDVDTDTDADADTDTGEEPPPQTTINVSWEPDGMTISIENGPFPAYTLGLLDTLNEDGWRGEDCLNGMAGHVFCHPLGETGGTLTTVFDIGLIEAGYTTRHTHAEGSEGALTYALMDPDGNCLASFGHLPDYYISSTLACPAAETAE
jgi:hypothetical protein